MIISLIAALTADHVIGMGNTIPWHLPVDLAWFKRHTLNKPIIMGRKTFESIGRPLPGRANIVLSRKAASNHAGVIWATSLAEALALGSCANEIMIIGGWHIYQQFLPRADRLYMTHIDIKITGDTWFQPYQPEEWMISFREFHNADTANPYNTRFEILDRR